VPEGGNVLKDETVRLQAFVAGRPDLEDLRCVTIWLEDKQEQLVLLTNNFKLAASTIAAMHWPLSVFTGPSRATLPGPGSRTEQRPTLWRSVDSQTPRPCSPACATSRSRSAGVFSFLLENYGWLSLDPFRRRSISGERSR
jgi:hypothetical protein